MNFQQVLSTAGLTKAELGVLYGVTRQTIRHWVHGKLPWPRSHVGRMAETVTEALLHMIARGHLPLRAMKADVRKRLVKELAARLQDLKPAPIK